MAYGQGMFGGGWGGQSYGNPYGGYGRGFGRGRFGGMNQGYGGQRYGPAFGGQPKTGGMDPYMAPEYSVNAPAPTGGANYLPGPMGEPANGGGAMLPGLGQPGRYGGMGNYDFAAALAAARQAQQFGPQSGMFGNGGLPPWLKGNSQLPYREVAMTNSMQNPAALQPQTGGEQVVQAPTPTYGMHKTGLQSSEAAPATSWFGQDVIGKPGAGWDFAQQVYGRAQGVGKYGDQFGTVGADDPFWKGVSPEFRPGGIWYGRR